jgi:hypothetical protein
MHREGAWGSIRGSAVKTACAVCALVLCVASPVLAQTAHPAGRVPPEDVLSSIRSMGLDPATRPLLRGRVYALRAFDTAHAEKRVLVDARSGEVLSVRAVADTGPAEEQYNPRYGHYEPPRPPARVAEAPAGEPILDEPLFPRAGRGAPVAAPARRSAALTPPPAPKVQQPAPAAGTAQDNQANKAAVGTSPAAEGATASSSAPAAPLASPDVLAAASSTPGKSVPAPVAAKPDSAKPATQFVPVAPLE